MFHYFVGNIQLERERRVSECSGEIQVRDIITGEKRSEVRYYTHNLDKRIAGSDSPVEGAGNSFIDSNAYTPAMERNIPQRISSVNTPPLPTGGITPQKKRGRTAYQAYLDRYDEVISLRLTAGPAERDTVWTRYLRRQEEELRAKALKTVEILRYVPEEYAGLLDEAPGTPSLAALAHHQNQRRNSDAEGPVDEAAQSYHDKYKGTDKPVDTWVDATIMEGRCDPADIRRAIAQETTNYVIRDINHPDSLYGELCDMIPPLDGYYDLKMHGSPELVKIFNSSVDSVELARIILLRRDYAEGPIRLLSCETRKIRNGSCIGLELSRLLGEDVLAPTELLKVFSSGRVRIESEEGVSGWMRLFHPDGSYEDDL